MANLRCDIKKGMNYDEVKTAFLGEEVPNGAVVFINDLKEGHIEMYEAEKVSADRLATATPHIVFTPEVFYDESEVHLFGEFVNPDYKSFSAVPVKPEALVGFGAGHLVKSGEIAIGDIFVLADGAINYAYSATAPTGVVGYFQVKAIENNFKASLGMVSANMTQTGGSQKLYVCKWYAV